MMSKDWSSLQRSLSHELIRPEKNDQHRRLEISHSAEFKLIQIQETEPKTRTALKERPKSHQVKYSRVSLHGEYPPVQFDHNFYARQPDAKMAMMPKHLPPIRELTQVPVNDILQQKTHDVGLVKRQSSFPQVEDVAKPGQILVKESSQILGKDMSPPLIKSSQKIVQPNKGDAQNSPATERQTRLRNKVLSNKVVDLPELKRTQALKTPHLVRIRDIPGGSETPSPLSSPTTSTNEEEGTSSNAFFPTNSFQQQKSQNVASNFRQKIRKSVREHQRLRQVDPVRKSSSMVSLVSSRESDSEDNPYLSALGSKHLRSLDPNVSGRLINGAIDPSLPKSRSLVCLAVATMAQMAGHPLMVNEARSRSYLVGSVGHTSMLGSEELEKYFPGRKIRLFVGSWNMNGQTPSGHLADFLLPQNIEFVPDLLVIGTQECMSETREWEVRLQDTLGPSHVLFHSHSLGTLHLAIFLRRDLIWFCSVPEVDSFSTRPGATFKTKGAVAIAFLLFGTSFLFVNSHLTAHQENVRDRVKDLTKINAMLNLPRSLPIRKRHRNLTDNFDCTFWCGDLNFRIEQTREVVIREVNDVPSILEFDQLNYLRSEGLVFNGFVEDPIRFLPTYKYDPKTNNFDTSSKQRTPAYTDRILYKCHKSTPVKALHYDIVNGVVNSDHKPVWGIWETLIRPGKDNIPLSGGLFNRDIYLEGLKRRSEALKPLSKGKLNNLCLLQ